MQEALKTAIIHGGLTCEVGDSDDPLWKKCVNGEDKKLDFMHVNDVNGWYYWLQNTVKTNVRVQNWYNGMPPYGFRGYLDDKANRLIGYAIIRQIRNNEEVKCR